ncbi:hypothetical protein [Haloarcula sp. Atlit-7R]|uniref:hypothetical protein n=1 Tax=Haloarcula sp. Atlit-7R TaxID=2282125 RepID=UPI0018F31F6A|nr:hypothetical protein [Haloarcula sp. Atlit-7R]
MTGALAGCSSGGRDGAGETATPTGARTDAPGPGPRQDEGPNNYFEQGPIVGVETVATGLVSPNALVAVDEREFVLD